MQSVTRGLYVIVVAAIALLRFWSLGRRAAPLVDLIDSQETLLQ